MSDYGPLETEAQAHAFAIRYGGPPRDGWSILSRPQNNAMLLKACQAAGVHPSAFERGILSWLAGFEDTDCAVVAGLILRASGAGKGSTDE